MVAGAVVAGVARWLTRETGDDLNDRTSQSPITVRATAARVRRIRLRSQLEPFLVDL
jgi:hypothetical protein